MSAFGWALVVVAGLLVCSGVFAVAAALGGSRSAIPAVHTSQFVDDLDVPDFRHAQNSATADESAVLDDQRILGAAYLRAYMARDLRCVAGLVATTGPDELTNGLLLVAALLAHAVGDLQGVSGYSVVQSMHADAIDTAADR